LTKPLSHGIIQIQRKRKEMIQMFGKKGIKITCPNCGGHTRVVGRYGECDYCGSPLVAPIADHVVAEFVDLEIKAIKRHDEMSALKADILRVLRKTESCTVSEITNQLREPVTNQKVAAVLRTMVNEGTVDRTEFRKKIIFYATGA
jgi:hypothetical protein